MNPLFNELLANQAFASFYRPPSLKSHFAEPALVAPDQGKNPDLIIVYLEGLESTYGYSEKFQDIYDPLHDLAAQGTSFSGVQEIFATGWSLGGTVASQCGTPLLPLGLQPLRRMADVPRIVPEVTCLSDILADRGYHSTYVSTTQIIGNTMGFYGFDNFFATHELDQIIDRDTANTPGVIAAREGSENQSWGLRDQDAFEIGLSTIRKQMEKDQPYALMIATMDTHGPWAFMSQSCLEEGQAAMSRDLRGAVGCTSRLTQDFVHEVRKLTVSRETRIMITSDHLAHRNSLYEDLTQFPRRNTFFLLGGDAPARSISKAGSMVDLYPTLLEWMGWLDPAQDQRAGLGVSLLSAGTTLVEQYGLDALNDQLSVDVELARYIWRKMD